MSKEKVALEHHYGNIPADIEYQVLGRGIDWTAIKCRGTMWYVPNSYIARRKTFTKDNESNLPTYEEIMLEESID